MGSDEREPTRWVRFKDMCSGGSRKLTAADGVTDIKYVYVEAGSEGEAMRIFREATGRDAEHVTCQCCGPDFAANEEPSLDEATSCERGTAGVSLDRWLADPSVLVLRDEKDTRIRELEDEVGRLWAALRTLRPIAEAAWRAAQTTDPFEYTHWADAGRRRCDSASAADVEAALEVRGGE